MKYAVAYILFGLFISTSQIQAQSPKNNVPENLTKIILDLDTQFWQAYNTCKLENLKTYITADVEFYHDKGGLTTSLSTLMESIKTGLCGNENQKVLREAKEGTVEVFPIANYGAIITGKHVFYIKEKGKDKRLDVQAKFTHVWQYKDYQWKMSRILSYDHEPIPINSAKIEVVLPIEVLKTYTGKYAIADSQTVIITIENNGLKLSAPNKELVIFPESKILFFHKQAPLTFEFEIDDKGQVLNFTIRENGNIVDVARKL